MQTILVRAAFIWVPLAVAVSGLAGLVYGAVQQDLRQGADDPQIQMAEDAAASLDAGASPSAVVPTTSIDLSSSLQPFVIVFDRSNQLLASSATLHGAPPPFPPSVLTNDRAATQDRITWQPEAGVRSAVVVQPWQNGFVVAGRSLRLVEQREDAILRLSIFGWLVTLVATALVTVAGSALAYSSRHRMRAVWITTSLAVSTLAGPANAQEMLPPPSIGGSAAAFEAVLGGSNDASLGAYLHFQRCAGTDVDEFVLMAPGDQVWTIQRAWCDLTMRSADERFADAAQYVPPDSVPGAPFTDSLGEPGQTYVSATLASELPVSLFHDCTASAVPPGSLFVVADNFGGWYMGPGTCPEHD